MATTTSFGDAPAQITAIDGSVARNANLVIENYDDLAVPVGATVNGIIVTWTGGYGGVASGATVMSVAYEGSADSSVLAANSTPADFSNISTVTYGSDTQLWGLSWTVDQANAITTKMFTESGTFYHDAFQVTIHYSVVVATTDPLKLMSGRIQLTNGKISI